MATVGPNSPRAVGTRYTVFLNSVVSLVVRAYRGGFIELEIFLKKIATRDPASIFFTAILEAKLPEFLR
jgi:hypothetical protein